MLPGPKWTKNPECKGVCNGCFLFCYSCNECGSLDEHGGLRAFKCRTTNPKTFNLCDGGN